MVAAIAASERWRTRIRTRDGLRAWWMVAGPPSRSGLYHAVTSMALDAGERVRTVCGKALPLMPLGPPHAIDEEPSGSRMACQLCAESVIRTRI